MSEYECFMYQGEMNSSAHRGIVHSQFRGLLTIVSILILFLGSITFIYMRWEVNLPGRASTVGKLSLENSYVFASPLSACSDGISLIRISVFLLNDQGLGVSGQKVSLKAPGGLSISAVQDVTDSLGKAYFDIASFTAGTYALSAETNGKTISQSVNIGFRDDPSCHR